MELATLLQQLSDNGFSLGRSGCTANALEVRGPTGRLTPPVRDALRTHKPALLKLLALPVDLEREAIQTEHLAPAEATAFPVGANARPDAIIFCPWCRATTLLEGRRGVWCLQCERLAWILTPEGDAVRADMASGNRTVTAW